MVMLLILLIMSGQLSNIIWDDFYEKNVLICYTNEVITKLIDYDNYLVLNSHFENLNDKAMSFSSVDSVELLVSGSKFYSFSINSFGGCILYMDAGSCVFHKITSFNMTCKVTSSNIFSYYSSNTKNYLLLSALDYGNSDFGAIEMVSGDVRCDYNNITNMFSNNDAAEFLVTNSESITIFSNCVNNTALASGILYANGDPYYAMKMYNIISNKVNSNDLSSGIVCSGFNGLVLSECVIINNLSPNLFASTDNANITVSSTFISGNNYQNLQTGSVIISTTNSFNMNFCNYSSTNYLTFVINAKQTFGNATKTSNICSCACKIDKNFAIFLELAVN